MNTDHPQSEDGTEQTRRRDHLRVVTEAPTMPDAPLTGAGARPRSIGRLIAQTALIADGAINRRRDAVREPEHGRGVGRLLGRFR